MTGEGMGNGVERREKGVRERQRETDMIRRDKAKNERKRRRMCEERNEREREREIDR